MFEIEYVNEVVSDMEKIMVNISHDAPKTTFCSQCCHSIRNFTKSMEVHLPIVCFALICILFIMFCLSVQTSV